MYSIIQMEHILCWKMGSCCTWSVFWVNWVILTDICRLWNWRNRPVFTSVTNPRKFYIFPLKICQDFSGKYIAQVLFARWRSSDKQLGPRAVNLVLIPARRCYTRILVHAGHSWLIYMDFITGAARQIKAFFFQKQKGIHIHTNDKGTISWDTRMQDLSMPELSLNSRNTVILLMLDVSVHEHNTETSVFLLLLQVYLG